MQARATASRKMAKRLAYHRNETINLGLCLLDPKKFETNARGEIGIDVNGAK